MSPGATGRTALAGLPGPHWEHERKRWPHAASSRFVAASGLQWHVQRQGAGPALLLLHGMGASSHTWRDMVPVLADAFEVIAIDLPGHGFTVTPTGQDLSAAGMADAVGELLGVLGVRPPLLAGHSAGVLVALEMALRGQADPAGIVSFNGAFLPVPFVMRPLYPALSRALLVNPWLPRLLALSAETSWQTAWTIAASGSEIGAEGVELCRTLLRYPGHVAGALGLLAEWDLEGLLERLPDLTAALLLVVAANDRLISPALAEPIRRLVPSAALIRQPGLGHLSHEEDAAGAAAIIGCFARACGVLDEVGTPL